MIHSILLLRLIATLNEEKELLFLVIVDILFMDIILFGHLLYKEKIRNKRERT